jgi:hypothetical protein
MKEMGVRPPNRGGRERAAPEKLKTVLRQAYRLT